jgi:hypothetical protein
MLLGCEYSFHFLWLLDVQQIDLSPLATAIPTSHRHGQKPTVWRKRQLSKIDGPSLGPPFCDVYSLLCPTS